MQARSFTGAPVFFTGGFERRPPPNRRRDAGLSKSGPSWHNTHVSEDLVIQKLESWVRQVGQLLEDTPGKWALVSATGILGTYDSRLEAILAGYQSGGSVPFLVQQIPADRPAPEGSAAQAQERKTGPSR